MAINPAALQSTGRGLQPQGAPMSQPGDPQVLLEIGPFKGLDTWRSPLQMQPDFLTTFSFLTLDDTLMSVVTDKGRQDLFTAFSTPLGFDVFYPSTGNQPYAFLVQAANWQQIDYIGGTAPVTVTLPYAWSSTSPTFFVTLKNIIMAANGTNPPVKIRDDWSPAAPVATQAGIATPTGKVTTAAGGPGNLNGTYVYRVTFASSLPNGHESSPGPVSDPVPPSLVGIQVSNQNVNLTNIPTSTDPQVNQRNIYRLGGSVPEWRLVGSINDNVTTTANDNVSDLNLGRLLTFDRDLPPAGLTQLIAHKGRVFGFIGKNLLFSNYDEPEGWPPTFSIPVGRADNIIGLGTTGSVLLIFKRGQTWGLFGESLSDFTLIKLYDVGALSTRGIVSGPGECFWLSEDGFRAATSGSGGSAAPSQRIIGTNVWNAIRDLPASVKKTCVMTYGRGKIIASFPDSSPVITYVLDLKVGDWEREKNPIAQLYGFPRMGEWNTVPIGMRQVFAAFAAGDPEQFIFTEYTTAPTFNVRGWPSKATNPYQDLGGNLSWVMERKQYDSGLGVLVKRYREMEIVAPAQSGAKLTVTLTVDDDTANKQYIQTFDLSFAPIRIGLPPNMVGRYITVNLSGSTSQRIQIDRIRIKGWIDHPYSRDSSAR